jgi:uncharacterized caspase-like protein
MRILASSIAFACGFLAVVSGSRANAQDQNSKSSFYNHPYESALAQARQKCIELWSDHAFDSLRTKIQLDGEKKPTFKMLTSMERLPAKDKPLGDLAIQTLEKCRAAWTPVYSLLPPQTSNLIHGVEREQDALIAELYNGQITFGAFNVGIDRLAGKLAEALSGNPKSSESRTSSSAGIGDQRIQKSSLPQPRPKTEQLNTPVIEQFRETRLALVIGNSNYANLRKLSNPINDARSIADVLQKLGYKTQLLFDASDQKIRTEVRKFASESSKADVALVFYAGHGAQLNGNNYLLPVDIDIPRTEADIQFAGLKVDDLVNSIGSGTKIVFLDACRDNPTLFKNIVSGRGSAPVGLAPATASNFTPTKPGGGVFIAYATDAGSVADDGHGAHSPFAEALLRYIQKPVSIDDMFSLVTREVRLVTKNIQRPYKYASLENIVCLTPACATQPVAAPADLVEQARQSEEEELQIALRTKDIAALETYLQKYPETQKRGQILSEVAAIKRSEHAEWTLYEIGDKRLPQYMQLNSIQQFGDRAAVRSRALVDETKPKTFFTGRSFPDAAYTEDLWVYDCNLLISAVAEETIFDKSGKQLFHYKWADPQILNLAIGPKVEPGSIGHTARNLACHSSASAPLVGKKQLEEMKFSVLASTPDGNGEILYQRDDNGQDVEGQKAIVVITHNFADRNVLDVLPGLSIPDPPNYRSEVDHLVIKCDENTFAIDHGEFWNSSNEIVRLGVIERGALAFAQIPATSAFAMLHQIFCGYAGLGVRFASDDKVAKIADVFSGSPAEKAGLKVGDVISQINRESVSGLTVEQVRQKAKGPANTDVILTILREGESKPIELTVTRGKVYLPSAQAGDSK